MGESKTRAIIVCTLLCFLLIVSNASVSSKFISSHKSTSTEKPLLSEQNIIIAPPEFYDAARDLQQFRNGEGISTVIVNTTFINTNYDPAEDPPFKGYATGKIPRLLIRNYNYDFAKKIITFLRDNATHPNMEYVTLFGNGEFIPASYYIHSEMRWTKKILNLFTIPDMYNNRIATDFFYTSPDYDLNTDYKVGRISVSTPTEATAYVHKIISWQQNVTWDWFQQVIVGGDQPNLPEEMDLDGCYAGEMIAADVINKGYFQGMDISKLFLTEGNFNKSCIIKALKEGESGFFFMMTHGITDRWGTSEMKEYVNADEMLELPENTKIPVIVSVACMCGAYDTHSMHPLFFMRSGQKSFGEAILTSKGAGIAYIGTTRGTLGSPLLYLDDGEVMITKERGIAGMLLNFFEEYHNGTIRLGDITTAAMTKYVQQNVFSDTPETDEAFAVLMSFVLLGDPVILLPQQQPQSRPSYQQPHLTAIDPEGSTSETHSRPWYSTNATVHIQIETNSSQVSVKIIDIDTNTVVDRQTFILVNNSTEYTFTSANAARYLIRASGNDGKEGWLYCTIKD
ncbi:MAG: C25 family cysteine peptidase [Euryarchaeota archaeon]|nr:C25 family cysteine peptidase [Euryarchaeota archaeon]